MIDSVITFQISSKDGAVRVDLPNPLYGDDPYTVQPGGCKEPGQYIHVTPDFLTNLNTTEKDRFGYVGNNFEFLVQMSHPFIPHTQRKQ